MANLKGFAANLLSGQAFSAIEEDFEKAIKNKDEDDGPVPDTSASADAPESQIHSAGDLPSPTSLSGAASLSDGIANAPVVNHRVPEDALSFLNSVTTKPSNVDKVSGDFELIQGPSSPFEATGMLPWLYTDGPARSILKKFCTRFLDEMTALKR